MFRSTVLLLTGSIALAGAWPREALAQIDRRETDVSLHLVGRLTLPETGGPFPAVIVTAGSDAATGGVALENGPFGALEDRMFAALAAELNRRGIAVLRVDHRAEGPNHRLASATTRDFAREVRDGFAYLQTHRDIAPDRIGVLGHGEGANMAAMVAAANADVAFLVMLAGAGVAGDELLKQQFQALMWSRDVSGDLLSQERAVRDRVFAQVKSERDGVAHVARRRALVEELTAPLGPVEKERVRALAESLLAAASSPWVRFFLWHDPGSDLSRVRRPVLALIGERDLQVPYRENIPPIRAALEAGGNRDHTVRSLAGLDHWLRTERAVREPVSDRPAETMAPAASALIVDWIVARVGR